MENTTKVLLWSVDEVRDRAQDALNIMEELDVDPLHWECVFMGVCSMLSAAQLHVAQPASIGIDPRILRGK